MAQIPIIFVKIDEKCSVIMPRTKPEVKEEVWRLASLGISQRQIAKRLGISRGGVAAALKLKPSQPLPPPPPPLEPDDISKTFDRRINEIIDTLLTRYRQMSLSPDTSNRDLVTLGRLIGSWSMLSRPERQIELAIANLIDSVADKISHDAFTELSAALDAQTHQIEDEDSRTNPNGRSTPSPTQTS